MNSDIDYQTHLDRLHRHFIICTTNPDQIALLDLSHSLRIWDDLKTKIPKDVFPKISDPNFKTISPSKNMAKIARSGYSVLAFFPNGTYTYAHKNMIASCDDVINGQPFYIAAKASIIIDKVLEVYNFVYVKNGISPEEAKELRKSVAIEKKVNFLDWMTSEIVRLYNFQNVKMQSISREKMITRMANAFNASHPKDNAIQMSIYDTILNETFKFSIGSLSLPYFSLLSIAKDILLNMPDILGIKNYEDVKKVII